MSISSLEQFIFAIAMDLFGSISIGTFHNSFTNRMYFTCTQNQRKTERHQQKQWAFERVSNHTKVKYRAKAALDIFSSSVAFYSDGLLPWPFSAFLKKMRFTSKYDFYVSSLCCPWRTRIEKFNFLSDVHVPSENNENYKNWAIAWAHFSRFRPKHKIKISFAFSVKHDPSI